MGDNFKTLQMIYAGALADSTTWYSRNNILEVVTEAKKPQQFAQGKFLASSLGITAKTEVFTKLAELFGCANWQIEEVNNSVYAVAKNCTLCSMCKKTGSLAPCKLHCLNPMEGMIKALDENYKFEVEKTLWDDLECRIKIG